MQIEELSGRVECAVNSTDTMNAIRLIDDLIQSDPGCNGNSIKGADLTASDRDRVLAHVYSKTYGPIIRSTVSCRFCNEKFELSFSLDDLLASMLADSCGITIESDGSFKTANGHCFRLPTGADELAIQGMNKSDAAVELLKRCVVNGDPSVDMGEIEAVMEASAPQLNLDLDAKCPDCSKNQLIRFDIQTYLLSSLLQEKKLINYEVHLIARTYGWSLSEIFSLKRSQRKAYASLIESDYCD